MSENEELVRRVSEWQSNKFVHPLTCGVDSRYDVLRAEERGGKVVLVCPTCGWVQEYMPIVISGVTDERLKALEELSAQAQELGMGYEDDGEPSGIGLTRGCD